MKRLYFVLIVFLLSAGLCRAMVTYGLTQAHEMGKQLLKAQNLKDQTQFKSIMNSAFQKFQGNKNAFYEFLDVRDGYGCTCLLRAAALSDIDQMVFIFEKLEKYYNTQNDGILDVFNFLNAQCLQGHTAFYLLAQNGTRQQLDLMLYQVIRLLGSEKKLFLEFLNSPAYEDGWTVLHWLAFQGSMVNLEAVVIVAERLLGKNSEEYNAFINAESLAGRTALDNAYFNSRHRQFIKEHGGISVRSLAPEVVEARKTGLALIEAIRDAKISNVQKIIFQAQKKYKETPSLFLEVMMTRSSGGWDPLMHAVAISKSASETNEVIIFLLHAVKTFFANDEEAFYSIMRNVAQDGRGALIIAILQRDFDTAHLILATIKDFAPSKYFLYILLDVRTYVKGYTPLLAAVTFNLDEKIFSDLITDLVETVVGLFGKDSRPVDLFVNARDLNGSSVLAYATTPDIITLLKSYGAQLEKLPF